MSAAIILYSDFNCPFCYALGERLIEADLADRVEWRGVQHAPQLPVPMQSAEFGLAKELENEVRAIRRLAPGLAIAIPDGKPNSGPAILAVIAALRIDPARAHAFKDSLYREFWQHGADLSDPVVLRKLATAAGFSGELEVSNAEPTAAAWQRDWYGSGVSGVPALISDDREPLVGLAAMDSLRAWFH